MRAWNAGDRHHLSQALAETKQLEHATEQHGNSTDCSPTRLAGAALKLRWREGLLELTYVIASHLVGILPTESLLDD